MADVLVAARETAATFGFVVDEMVARLGGRARASVGPDVQRLLRSLSTVRRPQRETAGPAGPAGEGTPTDGLSRLVKAIELSSLDIDLVVLAGLSEHHEAVTEVLRALNPRHEPWATPGLAATLLLDGGPPASTDRDGLRGVLEHGALVRHGVVHIAGDGPLWERSLRLAPGLWPLLGAPSTVDERSAEHAPALAGLGSWLSTDDASIAVAALRDGADRTVVVSAPSARAALDRARTLAVVAGVALEEAEVAGSDGVGSTALAAAARALARGAVPLLLVAAPDPTSPPAPPAPLLADHPGPVLIAIAHGTPVAAGGRAVMLVDGAPLDPMARREMWANLLPELADHSGLFATRHVLEPSIARAVVHDARSAATLAGRPVSPSMIATAVRIRVTESLPVGVRLVTPVATWDDFVLAPERLAQLHEAVARLRVQDTVLGDWGMLAGRPGARGVRLLLAGPSGTGKSLAAEVLARSLGADLLFVDLSRIVSKWLGETEKQLGEVFDAAERAQAVLFFDEADALFGERTEVRDAYDRYANLETAFLLTRLERFEGMAVLATNLRHHLDSAFTRRLEFVVEFAEPDNAERRRLWELFLGPSVPRGPSVDLDELAGTFALVGALIRNAAVAAACSAAAEGGPVEQRHVVAALVREYQKAGRPFPGAPAR